MFEVKAGTEVRCIREGIDWYDNNFRPHTVKDNQIFEKHEVVVDPIGKLGTHRGYIRTIGGAFATAGYYAFARDGWVMVAHANQVQYLD